MQYSFFLTVLLVARTTTTTPISKRQTLQECAVKALNGPNATSRVVLPSDDTYTDARLGEKVQFDEFPALIAYTVDANEVAPLIKCAKAAGIKAVPRSGGHHFESYSVLNNSLVIDLAHINGVQVSPDHRTAVVGGGIRLGAIYTALDAYNTTFVGGICPTVGLSGLLSAGGFNMQMRALGISADHVLSAEVVTADGNTVTASPLSNPNLFWAIRGGGGGSYGIVIQLTLSLTQMPRSSMVAISWNDARDRFPVAKTFLDWAPKQTPDFTSQINVYKSTVQVLGWYYGGSREQLQDLINASGLQSIGSPEVKIGANCNTDNSRLWGPVTTDCVPDSEVDASILNVIPDPFAQYEDHSQYRFDESLASTSLSPAEPWPRFPRLSKSFFVQKDNLLTDDTLQGVIDRIGGLDDASEIWGEWHAWNISGENDSAFAWRDQAYAHLEFRVHGSTDAATQRKYTDWFGDLESYLRPAVGSASYAGYMDRTISTPSLTSYYGSNVCRLIGIKKEYDPENFFTNPQAIPPDIPADIAC